MNNQDTRMADEKSVTVLAVRFHNPKEDDDLEAAEAVNTAPDLSVQLEVHRGQKFQVLGGDVDWWLYVTSLKSGEKGYIPSTCVVPLKENLSAQE